MRSLGLCTVVLVLASTSAAPHAQNAETDCEGCKDHPMLARYPGSILFGADQKAFEEPALPIGPVTQSDAGEPVAPKTHVRKGAQKFLLTLNGPNVDGLPDHGLEREKTLALKILPNL